MTEKDFQEMVCQAAAIYGWRVYHTYDSRRSAPGFPDLCLVRGPRLIFAELKTEKGKTSVYQEAWLRDLRGTAAEVYLWRPGDWDRLVALLR